MRIVPKIVKWLSALVVVALIGLAAWLYVAPPALIRVGAGYAAKIVCSNVFIAGRDAGEVLRVDVQAPGHPILKLMSVDVDESAGTVSAGLFGCSARDWRSMRYGLRLRRGSRRRYRRGAAVTDVRCRRRAAVRWVMARRQPGRAVAGSRASRKYSTIRR